MTQLKWILFGIITSLSRVCFSDVKDDSWRFRYYHMSMYTMVVSKGCTYLAGFVQSVYVRTNHDSKDANCNWQAWAQAKCTAYHMPAEICTGLMSCGTACTLSTLKAPQDMMNSCNVSTARVHGKRNHIDHTTLNLCSTSSSHVAYVFGRRDVNISNEKDQQQNDLNSDVLRKAGGRGNNNGHGSLNGSTLRKWCTIFSRYVRSRFHFNEVKFVRSSRYWLVDVYKIGPKFGVPLMHTHGLVGCGMEYALNALNAPSWITSLYSVENH